MEQGIKIYEIILIITGILMAIRMWLFYNFSLSEENKRAINMWEFINHNKNDANYFKVVPIMSSSVNTNSKHYKKLVNVITYLIYLLIFVGVIAFIYRV